MINTTEIRDFLPHVGARAGVFSDPPTNSFVVEGGVFDGVAFQSVVFTPTVVSVAAEWRVDVVVANPTSGNIELIEGPGGDDLPDLTKYRHCGKICRVRSLGRSLGRSIIERADILDLRSQIQVPAASHSLLTHGMVTLGVHQPIIGTYDLLGLRGASVKGLEEIDSGYPFPRTVLVVGASFISTGGGKKEATAAWLDLELAYHASDVQISLTPYNTVLRVGSDGSSGGFYWRSLPSVNNDADGPLPRFRIGVVAYGVTRPLWRFTDPEIRSAKSVTERQNAFASFQVWGRQ